MKSASATAFLSSDVSQHLSLLLRNHSEGIDAVELICPFDAQVVLHRSALSSWNKRQPDLVLHDPVYRNVVSGPHDVSKYVNPSPHNPVKAWHTLAQCVSSVKQLIADNPVIFF